MSDIDKCCNKIYTLYKNFYYIKSLIYDENNEDIKKYNAFLLFLDSKKDTNIFDILNNDIRNNFTNRMYYDDINIHDEFKVIIKQALTTIYNIDKPVFDEIYDKIE